ncbi:MAG: radical SAM protein [Eubacteriales bacterium]|nr:radical SAM protein [Eubacteriales bacterium]
MKEITKTATKQTYSLCPVCLKRIPAKLVMRDGCWYLEKVCEVHGYYKTVVWRGRVPGLTDWGNYHPPKEEEAELPDCPNDCGLCGKHLQSTCCVLVEVTSRCNLRCPVCFAESGADCPGPDKSVAELSDEFRFLIEKGCHFIQLSGGEPTVRDDLPEIIRAAKEAGATSVQLNSNGLRLGEEPEFTKRLAASGLDFVFLQFDGMDDTVNRKLRGRALLEDKRKTIEVCGVNGIGVTLVPTVVPGINDHQIGRIIKFGLTQSPVVRGVHFQPISYFGRYPEPPKDEDRITLPEIVSAIEQQTEGLIKISDLAPSSCDHPRCGFHGDFMILPGGLVSLTPRAQDSNSDHCCCQTIAELSADAPSENASRNPKEALRNRNFVARRWKRSPELEKKRNAAPSADEVMDFDTFLEQIAVHGFTVTGMAFQDAYTIDLERLRRCSLHVYDNGRILPFCAKYLTSI